MRTKRLAEGHGRTLAWLFELRGIADYGESRHVPGEQARQAIDAAGEFLGACRDLIAKKGLDLPE